MTLLRSATLAGSLALTTAALPAQAYPIDCAILLCLGGGFPPSAECSAAKAELIRRITPWPIEPPLQLWRCPMGGGGISLPSVGADGLTPEVRAYRDGIEVWELQKRSTGGSGGRESQVYASRNHYNDAGDFVREGVSRSAIPEWVDDALQTHGAGTIHDDYRNFRGILLRMQDYKGDYTTEWVSY